MNREHCNPSEFRRNLAMADGTDIALNQNSSFFDFADVAMTLPLDLALLHDTDDTDTTEFQAETYDIKEKDSYEAGSGV